MSKRSVSKVSHYSPTTFTFGERVRAGQQKINLMELWQMSVPRYQYQTLEEQMVVANNSFLDETVGKLRFDFQSRSERRQNLKTNTSL